MQNMGVKEAVAQYKDAREKHLLMTKHLDGAVRKAAETYAAIHAKHYRRTLFIPKYVTWYIDEHNIVIVEWVRRSGCGERIEESIEFSAALLYDDGEEAARIDARYAADVRARAEEKERQKTLRDRKTYERLRPQFEKGDEL